MFVFVIWLIIISMVVEEIGSLIKEFFFKRPQPGKRGSRSAGSFSYPVVDTGIIILFVLNGLFWGFISFEELGIKTEIHPGLCFFIGIVVSTLWDASFRYYFHKFAFFKIKKPDYEVLNILLSPKRTDKWLMIIVVVLIAPVYEEILFRGFLVHQWGFFMGSMLIPCLVGYAVDILLHRYQGVSAIGYHTVAYLLTVGCLLSPIGLIGSMGYHVGHNFFSCFSWWVFIKKYRAAYDARKGSRIRSSRRKKYERNDGPKKNPRRKISRRKDSRREDHRR